MKNIRITGKFFLSFLCSLCALLVLLPTGGATRAEASDIKVTRIVLVSVHTTVYTGEQEQVRANVYPRDATDTRIIWTTSNSDIATIDSDGLVYGHKAGGVVVIATAADGGGAQEFMAFTVKESSSFNLGGCASTAWPVWSLCAAPFAALCFGKFSRRRGVKIK